MQIVTNARVYDLEESIIASGYAMRVETENRPINDNDISRCIKLAKAGGAHEQFLTGIRVNFDLTLSNKAWVEAERYRFLEFITSQSTMHRISKFDLENQYVEYVDKRMIEIMNELKNKYNETQDKEDYLKLLYSNPCGFKITARMTTNYRCLKNIYWQRYNHRLPEWRDFCNWIKELPYMKQFLQLTEEN